MRKLAYPHTVAGQKMAKGEKREVKGKEGTQDRSTAYERSISFVSSDLISSFVNAEKSRIPSAIFLSLVICSSVNTGRNLYNCR